MPLLLTLAVLFNVAPLAFASGPLLYVPLDAEWQLETKGPWKERLDHRGLLAMRHPWEASTDGDFAQAARTVTVPPDWTGAVYLSFYCSDDYHTDAWRPDGSKLTAEGFVGHRYKQVLVNEKVVWSEDVSDPVVQGASPVYRVKLEVTPGEPFRLGLVTFDRTTSLSVLPGDFFQAGDGSTAREGQADAAKFASTVYWGDVALCLDDTAVPPGKRPIEERVASVHEKRWPIGPAFDAAAIGDSVTLRCDAPGGLPAGGFPIRLGLPFAPGKVSGTDRFRLQTVKGQPVYAQKQVTEQWPDGSVRWCRVDAVVPEKCESLMLAFKKDTAAAPKGCTARESPESTRLDSGAISLEASAGRLIHDLQSKGKPLPGELALLLHSGPERLSGTAEQVRILEDGPLRVEMLVEGTLQGEQRSGGSFHLYVTAWAGQPWIRCWLRLFNDTAEPLPVGRLVLALPLADPGSVAGVAVDGDFSVEQLSAEQRTLRVGKDGAATTLEPTAAFAVQLGAVSIAMPRMRERFPSGMRRQDGVVEISLIETPNAPIVFSPGEATSHEVWFNLGGGDAAAFGNAVAHAPVLSNPVYFCATGAFGPAWPVLDIPKYAEKLVAASKGLDWPALNQRFGVRDFPDGPYYDGSGSWTNNYYNRTEGSWAAWLVTGDAAWHERAEDVARLVMDAAVIHSAVPGQDWAGAVHGPGANHVPGPWSPTLRTRGLWLYDVLTGAPEAAEAYMGVADWVARKEPAKNSPSVRDHAGPMDAVVTAYDATGEPAWLDEGSKRLGWAWQHMDRRRGVWPETHGSMVYRGNVPWMVAQLAGPLYQWYGLTGDVEAAQAVVAMAESMICENTDWEVPGAMSGYSHNPHFTVSAAYDPLIIPILFAAHELTEDSYFLDAAKAQWARWEKDPAMDSVFNTFWHTPWLAACWKKYVAEIAPEPVAQEGKSKKPS